MSKEPNLYVFERTDNFDALLVYCREILKFDNRITEEVINIVIDQVLNAPVMSKEITHETLLKSMVFDPDVDNSRISAVRCNPRYEKSLLNYMNLFAQDLFEKVLALGVRAQYSNTHKKDRTIFIYKGLIHQNQFSIMEIY